MGGGWFMKKVWAILVLLALMSVTAPQASAKGTPLEGGEVAVDHGIQPMWLRPGETESLELTFKNLGSRTLNVSLEYRAIECPGGTRGEFSDSFFTLAPGEQERITVEVTSYSFKLFGWCLDETTIAVDYGQNLTPETASDYEAADYHDVVTHELSYDPTYEVLAIVVIVLLVIFVVIPKWKARRQ